MTSVSPPMEVWSHSCTVIQTLKPGATMLGSNVCLHVNVPKLYEISSGCSAWISFFIFIFFIWTKTLAVRTATVCVYPGKQKCQPRVSAAEIGQARTHLQKAQIDELLILFHGLCRWRKRMPKQKDQNRLCEQRVSSSQQLCRREEEVAQQVRVAAPTPSRQIMGLFIVEETGRPFSAALLLFSVCGKHKDKKK